MTVFANGIASVIVLATTAALACGKPPPALDEGVTVFRSVNVVSMTEAGTLLNRTVVVRAGRIESINTDTKAPDGARVIDGGGRAWLIPGLCDMHVHFPPLDGTGKDAAWRAATLLLANGVTTARGMVGHPAHIAFRKRLLDGEIIGPTVYMAGPPITFQKVKSIEQAKAEVAAQHAAGFDFIKSHRVISPDVYQAVQDTAKELGIAVTGHVDNEVGLQRAVDAGMQIEHLDGWLAAMLKDPALADTFGQMPSPEVPDAVDLARIPEWAARIDGAKVWSTPTLALFRMIADTKTPTPELTLRPEMKYILPQALEAWNKQRAGMLAGGPFKDPELAAWFIGARRTITQALQQHGGRIMAGSDSPQAFLVTGFALHDELGALVDAGLTPPQALRAATSAPAEYLAGVARKGSALGLEPDFGSVGPGKRADLVLLRADPTTSISATRQIDGVMLRGKWLDRAALDALLAEVEASVTAG